MAELHNVDRLVGQHHPDHLGVIGQVVPAEQERSAALMEGSKQACRTVLGHEGLHVHASQQSQITADLIPAAGLGRLPQLTRADESQSQNPLAGQPMDHGHAMH